MTANTPSSRKAKGRKLQREIREDLVRVLGIPESDILSVPGGVAGCDILLSETARKRLPLGIECKFQESIRIWEALEQATVNARKAGLTPALIFRRSRGITWIALPWDEFIGRVPARCCCEGERTDD